MFTIAKEYEGETDSEDFYVDATAMYLITRPESFEVIVTTNLFGDILSDEGAGLVGGLGMIPSGNIGADGALFEPVHGSAPDIAGQGIANPLAMILSAVMMLNYLEEYEAEERLNNAILSVLNEAKTLTPDLGGTATTEEVADVKGQVTSDYQDLLEKNWIQELHKKYPVEINKKVLKQLKK